MSTSASGALSRSYHTIVVTGGLGGLIAPHARSVHHYEPWLTLHGLRLLFWRNCDESGVQG